MLLAQCDDMVDALATDCSNQPFRDAVLPRLDRQDGRAALREAVGVRRKVVFGGA
jgi:hypothetical protein